METRGSICTLNRDVAQTMKWADKSAATGQSGIVLFCVVGILLMANLFKTTAAPATNSLSSDSELLVSAETGPQKIIQDFEYSKINPHIWSFENMPELIYGLGDLRLIGQRALEGFELTSHEQVVLAAADAYRSLPAEFADGAMGSFWHPPVAPLPRQLALNPQKVDLGEKLFHDRRLSKDESVSCSTCHQLDKGGTDRLPTSRGIGGAIGDINAPTVFNSGFNFVQFWNGRAESLEQQIDGPIHNPIEMNSSWQQILKRLTQDLDYRQCFTALYSEGLTADSIKDAIATFERSLTTPNSRFDRLLAGDFNALTTQEKEGFRLFTRQDEIILGGCVGCHSGINLGGNQIQPFPVDLTYFEDRKRPPSEADLGRYNLTRHRSDLFYFKVPSLRNVEVTAPYFHDGSAETLEEAVHRMVKYQRFPYNEEDIRNLVAFLKTLTGEFRGVSLSSNAAEFPLPPEPDCRIDADPHQDITVQGR